MGGAFLYRHHLDPAGVGLDLLTESLSSVVVWAAFQEVGNVASGGKAVEGNDYHRSSEAVEDVGDRLCILPPGRVVVRQNHHQAAGQRRPVSEPRRLRAAGARRGEEAEGRQGIDALFALDDVYRRFLVGQQGGQVEKRSRLLHRRMPPAVGELGHRANVLAGRRVPAERPADLGPGGIHVGPLAIGHAAAVAIDRVLGGREMPRLRPRTLMLPTRPRWLVFGWKEVRHVQPEARDDLFLGASGEAFHEYNTVLGSPGSRDWGSDPRGSGRGP